MPCACFGGAVYAAHQPDLTEENVEVDPFVVEKGALPMIAAVAIAAPKIPLLPSCSAARRMNIVERNGDYDERVERALSR